MIKVDTILGTIMSEVNEDIENPGINIWLIDKEGNKLDFIASVEYDSLKEKIRTLSYVSSKDDYEHETIFN